jgi:DNA-binding CsgD family transcriptional regulator
VHAWGQGAIDQAADLDALGGESAQPPAQQLDGLAWWQRPDRRQRGHDLRGPVLGHLDQLAQPVTQLAAAGVGERIHGAFGALAVAVGQHGQRQQVGDLAPLAHLRRRLHLDPAPLRSAGCCRLKGPPPACHDLPPGQLLHTFDQAGLGRTPRPRSGGVVVAGLVAPLSARVLEVLRLLAAGHVKPASAEELVITLDTVKRHVTHILDKVGAANRTQAVTRARELGLLR